MSRNNFFQFKQFKIIQEKAAMKVNTDGILLGAWTNLEGVKSVLDVGTGTGLIALMFAQRSDALITGVEIEKNAAEEAVQNVQNSNWGNRVTIYNTSFQEFAANSEIKFDLIATNPPFFSNAIKNANPHLSMARHNDLLSFVDIIFGAVKLLTGTGKLALILPFNQSIDFIAKARLKDLFLNRMTEIKPFQGKKPNRCLMEFGKSESILQKSQMTIFGDSKIDYSEDFKSLTRSFYLKH
jgi:tRNA1Val (adenine37-N6)-methyltransferase